MVTQVTQGIKISIQTKYQEEESQADNDHFIFVYKVTIENTSDYAVQLMRRHWHIFDSRGEYREVQGEGVVGEQPVLLPGEIYQYDSACNLTTDIGAMHGTYLMERQVDNKRFKVKIPEFHLIVPNRLN
jgi:ApaG protein